MCLIVFDLCSGWSRSGLPEQTYPASGRGVGQSSGETGNSSAEAGGGWEGCRWEREVTSCWDCKNHCVFKSWLGRGLSVLSGPISGAARWLQTASKPWACFTFWVPSPLFLDFLYGQHFSRKPIRDIRLQSTEQISALHRVYMISVIRQEGCVP